MKRTLVRLTMGLCLTASAFGIAAGAGVGTAGAASATPGKPHNVQALPQSNQIQISWTAPLNSGTSPITGYKAKATAGSSVVSCATTGSTSCTVIGVQPGTTYSVKVKAKNLSGSGDWSTALSVLAGAPFPPTGVIATPGVSSASVKFTPPAVDNASITSYTVTANPGGLTCVSATSLPCTVSGLTNGTAYTFTATATNPYGTSIASTPSAAVTPQPLPGAPTGASAVAGNTTALVSWTAPAPTGAPVTGYKATSLPGGKTCTSTAPTTSCTVTGLPNGTSFTFTVTAINVIGTGAPSAATNPVVPAPTVPGTPSAVTATYDTSNPNNYAWYTIGFTQGANGGSTITNNSVTVTDVTNSNVLGPIAFAAGSPIEIPYANTADGTSTGAVVASPGDVLQFTVTATNGVGTSSPSTAVTRVLPAWSPLAPTGVSATAGDTTADITWTAPNNPPNAPAIASYLVTDGSGDTCTATAPATTCTVTGLTNGTAYNFTVAAISATSVTGAASAPVSVTPVTTVTVPGVPTGVSATATSVSGNPAAYVNYTAPTSDGGSPITGYTVVVVDQTTSTTSDVAGSSSLATVTGLSATDSYTFSVYATNAVGDSAASTPVQAVPQGPTSVTGTTNGDGTAAISWTPSTVTLGNPVTGYGVSTLDLTDFVLGPSDSVGSSATTTTLSGLTLGHQYDVCVSAQNSLAPLANQTCTAFTA